MSMAVSILVLVDFDQEEGYLSHRTAPARLVSILVLVDFDQEARRAPSSMAAARGFNPCFGGL